LLGVLTLRTALFPEIEPRATGRVSLDGGHEMYWEESGHPDGVPVVFLHGGPGAGTMPVHRRFFDPDHFRIILFDQRGAGRSTPQASIQANTTADLVHDLETLRTYLSVERWHLFGGSWGSTLALAYAQAHPQRCRSLVLRGIFTCTAREVDWFLHGMGRFYPDAWQDFAAAIPEAERGDLLAAYYRRLRDQEPEVHMPAARAWATYEARCSTLKPNPDAVRSISASQGTLTLARIEAHYLAHGAFLEPDQLIASAGRLRGIPGAIIQGRYDMVCPVETADRLARSWPEAELTIVPDAGHSALEPGTRVALIEAVERFRDME
jgi:proline iminopeptidase